MTNTPSLDIAVLSSWIGRSESNRDAITPRLVREMNAMLDRDTPQRLRPVCRRRSPCIGVWRRRR
jgi:hydroxyacyl-ACP dehydratase HTD2-like protein with hotdog domain